MKSDILWAEKEPEFRKERISPILTKIRHTETKQEILSFTFILGFVAGALITLLACSAGGAI